MSLGESITRNEPPCTKYVGEWVKVTVGGSIHMERLEAYNERFSTLTLSPYFEAIAVSGKLPSRYALEEQEETITLDHGNWSIAPIKKETIEDIIKECERDFQAAWKEREKYLSEIEGKAG